MINQLSIYTKNEKGTMRRLLSLLAKEGINVLGIVNNDNAEFGIIRLLTDNCDKSYDVLLSNGYLCEKTYVIGVELNDEVGEMEKLLAAYDEMNVNIDYMYIGYLRENSMPVIMIHSVDMTTVLAALTSRGFTVH